MTITETLKTEYANNVIASIDERIQEAKEILAFLEAQRAAAVAFTEPEPRWFYVVGSRSGGDDHRIQKLNGSLVCSCKAGLSNRKCWAVKGIQYDLSADGKPIGSFILDEKFKRHEYGSSTVNHEAASIQLLRKETKW